MTRNNAADAARLAFLLNELRLPAIKHLWPDLAAQSDKEGWPAARFLARHRKAGKMVTFSGDLEADIAR